MDQSVIFDTIRRDSAISFPFLGISIDPPSYISVFGREIYFYGIVIALGFLLAILFCSKRAGGFGIKEDDFYDCIIRLIPISIIGARLYFVLFRLEDYISNPLDIFAIREGGLAIYGGIIAGVLTVLLFCRRRRICIPAMLDLLAFGLLIGQCLGRWGNFFNREAFGAQTDIFCRMGLTAPDGTTIYVHPTFLYESLWSLCAFIILLLFVKKRKYDGQCVLLYFFMYGLGRAWIEGLRTDSLYIPATGIRVSQALSILLVSISALLLIVQRAREHGELFVNTVNKKQEE